MPACIVVSRSSFLVVRDPRSGPRVIVLDRDYRVSFSIASRGIDPRGGVPSFPTRGFGSCLITRPRPLVQGAAQAHRVATRSALDASGLASAPSLVRSFEESRSSKLPPGEGVLEQRAILRSHPNSGLVSQTLEDPTSHRAPIRPSSAPKRRRRCPAASGRSIGSSQSSSTSGDHKRASRVWLVSLLERYTISS